MSSLPLPNVCHPLPRVLSMKGCCRATAAVHCLDTSPFANALASSEMSRMESSIITPTWKTSLMQV